MATTATRAFAVEDARYADDPDLAYVPERGAVDLADLAPLRIDDESDLAELRLGYRKIQRRADAPPRRRRRRARRVRHVPVGPRPQPATRAGVLRRHGHLAARGDPHRHPRQRRVHRPRRRARFGGTRQAGRPAWCSTPIRSATSPTSHRSPPCTATASPSTCATTPTTRAHAAAGDGAPAVGRATAARGGIPLRPSGVQDAAFAVSVSALSARARCSQTLTPSYMRR